MIRKITLLYFLILSTAWLGAQETKLWNTTLTKYSIKDGLTNNYIRNIIQDSDGIIWVSTLDGLFYFDGEKFHCVTTSADGQNGGAISYAFEDQAGNIWAMQKNCFMDPISDGCFVNINIYKKESKEYISLANYLDTELPFQANEIKEVVTDKDKSLWIQTTSKIYKYHTKLEEIKMPLKISKESLLAGISYSGNLIFHEVDSRIYEVDIHAGIMEDYESQGYPWLYMVEEEGYYFRPFQLNFTKKFTNPAQFVPFIHFKSEGQSLTELPLDVIETNYFLARDQEDIIWFFSGGPKLRMLKPGTSDLGPDLLQVSENIFNPQSFLIDRENTKWLGTENGLYRFSNHRNQFSYLLQGESIKGICKSDKGLFVNSLRRPHSNCIDEKGDISPLINYNRVPGYTCVTVTKNGDIWNGVYGDTIYLNTDKNSIATPVSFDKKIEATNKILESKHKKMLWIATSSGLYHLNKKDQKIVVPNFIQSIDSINQNKIHDILETASSFLLATNNGIFEIEKNGYSTQQYNSFNSALPFDFIYHINQDLQNSTIYWLSTRGGGLIRWDKSKNEFEQFTTSDGLSNNVTYFSHEDKFGRLWIPSNYGLNVFDKASGLFNCLHKQDGLLDEEFNFIANFYDQKDSTLYLGGLQGLMYFKPDEYLNPASCSTPLQILKYEKIDLKSGISVDKTSELSDQKIELQKGDFPITFEAQLMDFNSPEKNVYAYKIGDASDWRFLTENTIRINRLDYGVHKLQVKAKSPRNNWSTNIVELSMEVIKPIYLRTWFILLCILISFALLYSLFQLYFHKLERDKEKLETIVEERTKELELDKATIQAQANKLQALDDSKTAFFTNVAHEIRTPLSLIIGPLKESKKAIEAGAKPSEKMIDLAYDNSLHLKKMIDSILDLAKMEFKQVELKNERTNLRKFLLQQTSPLETKASLLGIKLVLNFLPAQEESWIDLDQEKFITIYSNLINNAIKFSKKNDTIRVNLIEEASAVIVEVEDEGPGIPEDELANIFDRFYQSKTLKDQDSLGGGLGLGLSISQSTVQAMGGSISAQNLAGKGCKFVFSIPLTSSMQNGHVANHVEDKITSKGVNPKRKGQSILVVEDNVMMQDFLIEILAPSYDIITAFNGEVALEMLDAEVKVDLIVSDIMMPLMNGLEFLKIVKSKKGLAYIPFIILTAKAESNNKIEALRFGTDDYITKPFDALELKTRISNLLDKSNARKQQNIEEGKPALSFEELNSADQIWIEELHKLAVENIENEKFKVPSLASKLNLSERQFTRKLKKLYGTTPGNFLKEIRLQKARNMLENKVCNTVAETSYKVGFSTPEYFSTIFKERFGKNPSSYFEE